jgi:hypothetical protein
MVNYVLKLIYMKTKMMVTVFKHESTALTHNVCLFLHFYFTFVVTYSEAAHQIKYVKSKMIIIYSK